VKLTVVGKRKNVVRSIKRKEKVIAKDALSYNRNIVFEEIII